MSLTFHGIPLASDQQQYPWSIEIRLIIRVLSFDDLFKNRRAWPSHF